MWQGIKNVYHLFVALLAAVWYGFPSRKLIVIGVTGTDGKTTTVWLIYHILKTAKKKVSMISSVGAAIGGETSDIGFHVTTPSPFALEQFIKKVSEVSDFLVLEVTSHALDQHRVWGVNFTAAVLTNVTYDHLDYHKTYENYVATKAKLLSIAKVAVINRDDESYPMIENIKYKKVKIQRKNKKWVTYGMGEEADINPKIFPFKTKLQGEFNRYNILAAVAACGELGIEDEIIRKAIASFDLPIGRMEVVYENEFTVMVDFAHTPNALEQILQTMKPSVKGRLIHVFGSAGQRDYQKRPEMGRVSARYADIIVLTAEDPRSESVEKIMKEIAGGIEDGKLLKVANRQEAISRAIKMARKGDLILLTGKGHEKSMNYGRGEELWSEHEAVRKALRVEDRQ